jgi:hypothetical protein
MVRFVIIIIILRISCMQGIHTYIPETNHVPREHRVADILVLLFLVLISLVPALTPLYLYASTLRSMCSVIIIIIIIIIIINVYGGLEYLRGFLFKSPVEHLLVYSLCIGKNRGKQTIRRAPLPSISFPVHYSQVLISLTPGLR